jgi:hypothetical protein
MKYNNNELASYIPREKRRLDSLAWMVHGGNKCGAAYFNGITLSLATNAPHETDLAKATKIHLMYVAQAAKELAGSIQMLQSDPKFPQGLKEKAIIDCIKQFKENIEQSIKFWQVDRDAEMAARGEIIPTLITNVNHAIVKTTTSLIESFIRPGSPYAHSEDLTDAIFKGRISYVTAGIGINQRDDIHAEMKLAFAMLLNIKLVKNTEVYVGTSKRCCFACEAMLQAIAEEARIKIETREGGHQIHFPAAIPTAVTYKGIVAALRTRIVINFLTRTQKKYGLLYLGDTSLEEVIIQIQTNENKLEEILNKIYNARTPKDDLTLLQNQLHRRSPSPPTSNQEAQDYFDKYFDKLRQNCEVLLKPKEPVQKAFYIFRSSSTSNSSSSSMQRNRKAI